MNIIEQATEFSRDFELYGPGALPTLRSTLLERTLDFIYEEIGETAEAIDDDNRAEIIDGFGDIAFIALHGIYKEFRTSGDDHEIAQIKTISVMNRICEANLSKKHPDGSIIYANSKVQKPEGCRPPIYGDLL